MRFQFLRRHFREGNEKGEENRTRNEAQRKTEREREERKRSHSAGAGTGAVERTFVSFLSIRTRIDAANKVCVRWLVLLSLALSCSLRRFFLGVARVRQGPLLIGNSCLYSGVVIGETEQSVRLSLGANGTTDQFTVVLSPWGEGSLVGSFVPLPNNRSLVRFAVGLRHSINRSMDRWEPLLDPQIQLFIHRRIH